MCREYNVYVEIQKGPISGVAIPWDSHIIIRYNNRSKPNIVMSVLFHEIGHILSYRNGKYKVYNGDIWAQAMPPEHKIRIFERTALKAEIYADTLGRQIMKKCYPNMDYYAFYDKQAWRQMNKKIVKRMLAYWSFNKKKGTV